jgi:hypothetical protein
MPRYYFHILNGRELYDEVGVELADLNAAKAQAVKFAGEALKSEQPTDIWQGIKWGVKVTDRPSPHEGRPQLALTLTATEA